MWAGGLTTALPNLVGGSTALDVNNSGQIVGYGATLSDGATAHAVLWTR